MYFVRRYRFVILFLAVLVFSSVMVIREFQARQSRHVELRESLILLHSRGYTNEANRLYKRLLNEVANISDKELMDDFQRTVILVDPYIEQPKNPIYNYHWTVSNELDKRSESTLKRALRLAERTK